LGSRRSYTQLSGSGSNTISGMLNAQAEQHPQQQAPATAADCDSSSGGSGGGQLGRSNSSQQSSGTSWQGPLAQGAPYAVCQTGAKYPAFVGSSVQLGLFDDRYTHFYSISPDACTNPTIYWLGR
jgi:hypothetical protein